MFDISITSFAIKKEARSPSTCTAWPEVCLPIVNSPAKLNVPVLLLPIKVVFSYIFQVEPS